MAEDLTVDPPRPMVVQEPPKREPRRFVHGRRFAVAYALLALALVGAGALLFAAFRLETEADREWSAWRPSSDEGTDQLQEIANHVARRYSDGSAQLPFQAVPGPPQARVRSGTNGSTEEIPLDAAVVTGDESNAVRLNTAVAYSLCARGQNCAITQDAVQRDFGIALNGVLELALYTFKYVDGVESILFFMPTVPVANQEAGDDGLLDTVVFLQRDELEEQLDRPLSETPISTSGDVGPTARKLLRPRLYTFTFDATGQGVSLLRLKPYGGG